MPREAWVLVKAMVSDAYPDNSLPGPQPPFPPRPGGGPVDPGYSPPWAQAPVDPGYSPPWARPQPPHAGWPVVPGWPGGSLPGGAGGFPHPSHPIYNPAYPDNSLPGSGLGTWGGGNVPFPTPPIYIPITPPPDSGLSPEHPIYIPVQPPGFWGPNDPRPTNPIANPGDPNNPGGPAKAEVFKKIKAAVDFWTGNLPTDPNAPPTPTPV